MKLKKIYLAVFLLIACNKQDETVITDIFHRWQWVLTTYDTRGRPVTAEQRGFTYYYEFTKEGRLLVLSENDSLLANKTFTFTSIDEFKTLFIPEDSVYWGYEIRKDTLLIWTHYDIFPETQYFIKK